jgi:hypothetical protein
MRTDFYCTITNYYYETFDCVVAARMQEMMDYEQADAVEPEFLLKLIPLEPD